MWPGLIVAVLPLAGACLIFWDIVGSRRWRLKFHFLSLSPILKPILVGIWLESSLYLWLVACQSKFIVYYICRWSYEVIAHRCLGSKAVGSKVFGD